MDALLRDVRSGARLFLRHRGLTAIAVLMLAVGIGANTAIFSVANAVLLRPLAMTDPGRVLVLWERDAEQSVREVSLANFRDWEAQASSFTSMAAVGSTNWWYELQTGQTPVGIPFAAVSPAFFETLGATAALGRTFLPTDDTPPAARVVVLSHGLWQRQFGSDPAIVGRSLTLTSPGGTHAFQVVGVMPPGFDFPRGAELWSPVGRELTAVADAGDAGAVRPDIDRGFGVLYVIGRLKSNAQPGQVKPELDAIVANLATAFSGADQPREVVGVPVLDHLFGNVRLALVALLIAVGLVLLIACANVAGMLTVVGRMRQAELAMRAALGASRARIIRQVLTEGTLLAVCGAATGVLLAHWVLPVLLAVNPVDVPGFADVRMDARVLLVALGTSAVTAVLVGLVPAWRASRVSLVGSLKAGNTGALHARRTSLGPDLVVTGQVALATLVVIGAALMLRSYHNVSSLDLGFAQDRVLTFGMTLSDDDYPTLDQKHLFFEQLLARLEAQPGVDAAGAIYQRPMAHGPVGMDARFLLEGQPLERASFDKNPVANWEAVTPGYFSAMRIALREGRLFDETDTEHGLRVVIVSESFARRVWPGQSAVGKRLLTFGAGRDDDGAPRWQTVVGVVGDVRYREIELPRLDIYLPHRQAPIGVRDVVVRTATDGPEALGNVVRREIAALNNSLEPADVTTMAAVVSRAVAPWRFTMLVFTLFGAIALGLTAAGIFGVVASTVSQRTREIGLRVALGAQRRDVLALIMRQGVAVAVVGVAIGGAAAALLSRLVSALLFDVAATDITMYAVAASVMLAATLLASYWPARRAAAIEPVRALREP